MSLLTIRCFTQRSARFARSAAIAGISSVVLLSPSGAHGQLTLAAAREAAHRASAELRGAREAVNAASERERQARAFPNPTFAYGREQTSRDGQTNAQNVAQLDQPLEIGGQRSARREVARLRREAAEVRLNATTGQLDFDVARAFALAVAAGQRARIAEQTSAAIAEALRVSEQRLAAGDVAGYVIRRLRLEAARFAAFRAAAMLERSTTRAALSSLMGQTTQEGDALDLPATLPQRDGVLALPAVDSLQSRAELARPDLRVALLDAEAAAADARLTARERIPTPTLSAGYKDERVADPTLGSQTGFRGIVAGLTIPIPLFDRRAGSIAAAEAESRRFDAQGDALRRRVRLEVSETFNALLSAHTQLSALAPYLGEDARVALQAVQVSYAEGEISLVEWLDAVRAFHEAESILVTLQAEIAVRQAALELATGAPLSQSARPN